MTTPMPPARTSDEDRFYRRQAVSNLVSRFTASTEGGAWLLVSVEELSAFTRVVFRMMWPYTTPVGSKVSLITIDVSAEPQAD